MIWLVQTKEVISLSYGSSMEMNKIWPHGDWDEFVIATDW